MRWRTTLRLLAAVALYGCKAAPRQADAAFRPLDVGAVAPAYEIRTLRGEPVRLGAGQPVTLLNVWATWCTSCREEMALLDSLQRELGPHGLRVVGVSVDQGPTTRVQQFVESNAVRFPIAHDQPGDIQRLYQLVGVPTSFVIDRDGRVLWRHTGNVESVTSQLRGELTAALSRR
jgi:cytochrome c biogenesis protein CcmG/thiol:disulfide interchange protein DsbE